MNGSTCGTCHFWRQTQWQREMQNSHGECRRRSPIPAHPVEGHAFSPDRQFPETHETDWCGDHQTRG